MAKATQSFLSSTDLSHRTPVGEGRGAGHWMIALFDRFATWSERRRQRRALEALPDHLLSDIGISRADAEQEAHKPFWQG
ncbi:MAG: DUF1127 domain-containing protein [Alphaproteobacteria bacterium]